MTGQLPEESIRRTMNQNTPFSPFPQTTTGPPKRGKLLKAKRRKRKRKRQKQGVHRAGGAIYL
jgi:hypothetical protein